MMAHKHRYTIVIDRRENSITYQCSFKNCEVTITTVKKRKS